MELKIEYMSIDSLEPYKNNTRKHSKKDIDEIIKSIKKFGMNDPIGIWSDHNIIVEGHGRLEACKKLDMKTVPCIRLDHMTDEERREYGIMHNRTAELSEWDFDMLNQELSEIDLSDFDINMDELKISTADFDDASDVKEVDAPKPPKDPKSKQGQIYKLGNHRLMCGDSTNLEDVKKLMNGAQADLLYTDPPYNVNIENSDGMTIENDHMDNESFYEFLRNAFNCAADSMAPGAAFYVWYASREHINFESALKANNLTVREQLIWVKNSFTFGRQDYKWQHEPCLYGWKDGASHYFVDEHNHPTVFNEDKPKHNDLHPTMKPIKLCSQMIRNSCKKGQLVLDLFGGSGSTMISCEQLERTCYTMEYDPQYVDVIIERWEKLTGKKAELLNE